jgi:hypothetical protein
MACYRDNFFADATDVIVLTGLETICPFPQISYQMFWLDVRAT